MGTQHRLSRLAMLTWARIIRESLKLGRHGRSISKCCILEGEMVVYNDGVCPNLRLRCSIGQTNRSKATEDHALRRHS